MCDAALAGSSPGTLASPKRLNDTLAAGGVELLILNCDRYADAIRQVVKQKDRYNPEVPVIAMQAEADEAAIENAMRAGAWSSGRPTRISGRSR